MPKYITILRPNGIATLIRSQLETAAEDALTEHEKIINELYQQVVEFNKVSVNEAKESKWEKRLRQLKKQNALANAK